MRHLTDVTLLKVRVGRPRHVEQKDGTVKIIRPPHFFKAAWWGLRDGRRRRFTETIGPVGTITRKDAKRICAEKQDAMNVGRISPDRLHRMNLAEFLERDVEAASLARGKDDDV